MRLACWYLHRLVLVLAPVIMTGTVHRPMELADLHQWALYPQPNNVEFDSSMKTVTVDLRERTLLTSMIDDTNVSLVSGLDATFNPTGADPERNVTFTTAVCWKLEGPVSLRSIVEEWTGHFESFARFMTMRPSVVSRIDCHLEGSGVERLDVGVITPRIPRPDEGPDQDADNPSPHKYLTKLQALEKFGIDPADMLGAYWQNVATGDAYMAMDLHLESQDRLLNNSNDGALLNAIRSVESLYAAQHPGVKVDHLAVQVPINAAVSSAGEIGAEIREAWPGLAELGKLRRDAAHGKGRPHASFALRCVGGAIALRWIQRVCLLVQMGIGDSVARSIVAENFQYPWDLRTLRAWSTELGDCPAP